jgi:hypothetical protein
MKLVLIQGDHMANYTGRAQEAIVKVHNWDGFDVRVSVEAFRLAGARAFA